MKKIDLKIEVEKQIRSAIEHRVVMDKRRHEVNSMKWFIDDDEFVIGAAKAVLITVAIMVTMFIAALVVGWLT